MLLPLSLISLLMIQLQFRFSVVEYLQRFSLFFHQKCLDQLPVSETSSAIAALVCGKNFEKLSEAQLYSTTGLIHLFVVSGSHLLLIQRALSSASQFILKKDFAGFIILILFVYCAVCLFNPPVLRSFIFLSLNYTLTYFHRHWPKDYVLLLAGLVALALNPPWCKSLSLQMSWIAALALEVYGLKFHRTSVFIRQILFYFLFLFCFRLLGFPEFSVVVVGVFLSPVLEYVLFPLAFLTVMFHFFEPLFSRLIHLLNDFLKLLEYYTTPSSLDLTLVITSNWVIIFTLHFLLFFRKPKS